MKSKNESLSFKTAVENALNGQWVLPAFQRDLKWKRNQNILLFDSLRSGYPVGTLLCAKAGALTKHRLFEHCNAEDSEDFEYFVLARKAIEFEDAFCRVDKLLTIILLSPTIFESICSAISANVYSFFLDTTQIEC